MTNKDDENSINVQIQYKFIEKLVLESEEKDKRAAELVIINNELLKLNTAINSAKDVVFLTDTNGIFTYINSYFTKLYGYESDKLIGEKTPRILKSGLLTNEDYKNLWTSLFNKIPVNLEIKNKHKDGHLIDIDLN